MTRALIVVDVQKDFCEGGSLAVAGGLETAHRIFDGVTFLRENSKLYDYVVATKDNHLADNDNDGHFADEPDYKDTWPAHCVQGTKGAEFAGDLYTGMFDEVFYKGAGKPAYSGFQGLANWNNGVQHQLDGWLHLHRVDNVDICGIATDYCVLATAEDAMDFGYRVRIIPGWTVAVGGKEAKQEVLKKING